MQYRVYLLDDHNKIRAAESFVATDDQLAREVATALHEAAADDFPGCELWRGPVRLQVTVARQVRMSTDLAEIQLRRAQHIIDLETSMADTFACIRQSKRLMATLAGLQGCRPQ